MIRGLFVSHRNEEQAALLTWGKKSFSVLLLFSCCYLFTCKEGEKKKTSVFVDAGNGAESWSSREPAKLSPTSSSSPWEKQAHLPQPWVVRMEQGLQDEHLASRLLRGKAWLLAQQTDLLSARGNQTTHSATLLNMTLNSLLL